MSFGRVFRGAVNCLLRPLNLELTKYRGGVQTAHTMAGGLARAAKHGIAVRSILDIGASNGRWSRLALQCFPAATVLAFEPLAERQESLGQMKSREPRFDFVTAAAGNENGKIGFHVAADLDGSGVPADPSANNRRVDMVTVDTAISQRALPPPYLLKFDTHGFEVPILAGAVETLRSTNLIIMEVYNFRLNADTLRFHEMCGHLEQHGFRTCDVVDLMLRVKDQAFWQADIFFARKEHAIFEHESYA